MIFDVKMDLTRKARLVAGGHQTDPPKESTYSSVVSRDRIKIAFTLAALNDLDVLSANVQGAYLNAPTKEKVYTIAGWNLERTKLAVQYLLFERSMVLSQVVPDGVTTWHPRLRRWLCQLQGRSRCVDETKGEAKWGQALGVCPLLCG
jgi:hypothetical protein